MSASRPHASLARLLAVLLCVAGLAQGCGKAEEAPSGSEAPADAGPGPKDLLARLTQRMLAGTALGDESWGQDVDFLRRLLWPDLAPEAAARAAKAHAAATHVAGDIAREIAQDPGARAGIERRDAVSLALHDGWLTAAQAGPEVYKRWCETAGQDLLKRLEAERAKLFERPGAGR
jgi:hypothetical protein